MGKLALPLRFKLIYYSEQLDKPLGVLSTEDFDYRIDGTRFLWFSFRAHEVNSDMVEWGDGQLDNVIALRTLIYGDDSVTSEAVQTALLATLVSLCLRDFVHNIDTMRDVFVAFTLSNSINLDSGQFASVLKFTTVTAALTYLARLALFRDCLRELSEAPAPQPNLHYFVDRRVHSVRTAKPSCFQHMRR